MERPTPFDVLRDRNLKKAKMIPDAEANPYAGREYRMPNQFGESNISVTDVYNERGDHVGQNIEAGYHYETLYEDAFEPDEVDQLKRRGVESFPIEVKVPEKIFPYETGEGVKA